jgi:hypothetical protein
VSGRQPRQGQWGSVKPFEEPGESSPRRGSLPPGVAVGWTMPGAAEGRGVPVVVSNGMGWSLAGIGLRGKGLAEVSRFAEIGDQWGRCMRQLQTLVTLVKKPLYSGHRLRGAQRGLSTILGAFERK